MGTKEEVAEPVQVRDDGGRTRAKAKEVVRVATWSPLLDTWSPLDFLMGWPRV